MWQHRCQLLDAMPVVVLKVVKLKMLLLVGLLVCERCSSRELDDNKQCKIRIAVAASLSSSFGKWNPGDVLAYSKVQAC
jgi:hypothetical protein